MNTAPLPLFPDLPAPARSSCTVSRSAQGRCIGGYVPRNKAMQTASEFAAKYVGARDGARKTECYLKMVAAILAKDGLE